MANSVCMLALFYNISEQVANKLNPCLVVGTLEIAITSVLFRKSPLSINPLAWWPCKL